ncbi:hypothetical protein ACHQM5_004764 [Ranunculus cassubicifolius]
MALNLGASSLSLCSSLKHKDTHNFFKLYYPANHYSLPITSFKAAAQSEGFGEIREDDEFTDFTGYVSSARTQMDLLEQLTSTSSSSEDYASEGDFPGPNIRDQLLQLVGDREGEDFSIPLGKNLKKVSKKFLTTSQKRNIKRQDYLNDVSKRNDAAFFSTIAAFVILPPIVILVVAVVTGYVQLLP